MPDYEVEFETHHFETLDWKFALLARQDYNLGDDRDWFGCFRGGLYGLYARLYGVAVHFRDVHAWLPAPKWPRVIEYHVSSIFFGMDSAVECFVFAMNGLGNAISPADFQDVTDPKALRDVAPWNIIGPTGDRLPGYARFFPTVQGLWMRSRPLLDTIFEQHDVSKHRNHIFSGGRSESPEGFSGYPIRMTEIQLDPYPKMPLVQRATAAATGAPLLEDLVIAFRDLMNETARVSLEDARANIPLKETVLRKDVSRCRSSDEGQADHEVRP